MDFEQARKTVTRGYDRIVDRYLEIFGQSEVRAQKIEELVQGLDPAAPILDFGCGSGVPVARDLIARGFEVIGVDGSLGQIERARQSVPEAHFIHADMMKVKFPSDHFAAIAAFYSISHIPREEQSELLKRIFRWLRPGGRFLASFGTMGGDWSGEWLGVPMFFSGHDLEQTKTVVAECGFHLQRAELLKPENDSACFLWLLALKT